MEGKLIRITIKNTEYRIPQLPRKLICGGRLLTLPEVLNRQGGLIIGEGDTGKSTYVQMLYEAAKAHDKREPILVKLRTRPRLEVPGIPEGEVQTIIYDGLDEYPECDRDIVDLTDNLDPERYHIWVTSRPCSAAENVSKSQLLEQRYKLAPFTHDDVCEIARAVKLDGEAFMSRVHEAHLEPFIVKPGGAIILMQLFANGKLKPSAQTAHSMNTGVMETIMLDFARETRDGDDATNPKLVCTEKKIVDAACWIAACLVFSARDAIWTGPKSNCPANDICLGDLPPREYGTTLFKAILGLRLFEPLSPTRYRLAYSEMPPFLTGCWLVKDFPVEEEKLEKLPPYPASTTARSMPLEAIAWATAYNTAFSEPFLLEYPSKFLKFHALIEETGFNKFFSALCRKNIYLDDDSESSECYSLIDESDFAGCTEFAKMLQNALDSNQYSCRDEEYIRAFLAACESEPHYSYRLPSSTRIEDDDVDDPYSNTPLSPAELDALAPSKEKPVNEMVSVVPEGFVDKVAEALAKKTKNKGGRPKKDACRRCISVETAAELIGCPASMLENWERYERTDGETGCAPIEIVYEKNGITKRVKYTVKLRENCTLENARILRAIGKALEFAEAGKKLAAEKKIVRFKDEQKLDNMNFHHGIVRTQNPKGT